MILEVRKVLERRGSSGFDEILVESGLQRDELHEALAYWERRGNVRRIAFSTAEDRGATGSCRPGKCAGCKTTCPILPSVDFDVFEWVD